MKSRTQRGLHERPLDDAQRQAYDRQELNEYTGARTGARVGVACLMAGAGALFQGVLRRRVHRLLAFMQIASDCPEVLSIAELCGSIPQAARSVVDPRPRGVSRHH